LYRKGGKQISGWGRGFLLTSPFVISSV
jgi:hypothetical protein